MFGGGQRVFGGRDAGTCFEVLALRDVNFLLCDELWARFLHVGQARIGDVGHVVSGFGAALFFVRARHVLLAAAHRRFVLLELLLQFRNFQHGE